MSPRALFSRRDILSAAGLGAAVLSVPRWAAAGRISLASVPTLDVPGGADLAQTVLERYRSMALSQRQQRAKADGDGVVRFDLGRDMRLEVTCESGDSRSIVVEAAQGLLELECSETREVRRVVAQLDEGFATRHPRGYDALRRTEDGVELTFSDDLALRYASPHRVVDARPPEVYDELAERVLAETAAATK